jgi:uncharacterized protein
LDLLPTPAPAVRTALLFEAGLGLAAIAIGWLVGHDPAIGTGLADSESGMSPARALFWGVLATFPLATGLVLIDRLPLTPLRRLRDLSQEIIVPLFAGASIVQLALVSVLAGLGEELLFRGLVQAGVSRLAEPPAGVWIGLAVGSVLFGVCHWLNSTYALLAMLAGLYFGVLLLATGSLWTPIIAHALYDFVALMYLLRPKRIA